MLFKGLSQDIHKSWVTGVLPRFTKPQCWVKDEAQRSEEIVKVGKSQRIDYIAQVDGIRFTHVFLVPKGADDTMMVYIGTSSGLNDNFWSPHFDLPTERNTLRDTEEWLFMAILWSGYNSYEELIPLGMGRE